MRPAARTAVEYVARAAIAVGGRPVAMSGALVAMDVLEQDKK